MGTDKETNLIHRQFFFPSILVAFGPGGCRSAGGIFRTLFAEFKYFSLNPGAYSLIFVQNKV